jgi:hypothetical protein
MTAKDYLEKASEELGLEFRNTESLDLEGTDSKSITTWLKSNGFTAGPNKKNWRSKGVVLNLDTYSGFLSYDKRQQESTLSSYLQEHTTMNPVEAKHIVKLVKQFKENSDLIHGPGDDEPGISDKEYQDLKAKSRNYSNIKEYDAQMNDPNARYLKLTVRGKNQGSDDHIIVYGSEKLDSATIESINNIAKTSKSYREARIKLEDLHPDLKISYGYSGN